MEASDAAQSLPDLETIVPRLRDALGHHQFAQVLHVADELLTVHQGNRDLLYLTAVSQRMLQRIAEALTTLATLETYHPRYSRVFQERGHCHVFLREAPKAIEATPAPA